MARSYPRASRWTCPCRLWRLRPVYYATLAADGFIADCERKIGLDGQVERSSGRCCGSALTAGRLTLMSTVASGAATMKIMSSTSITSMNGVTLISWTSFSASSPWSRRMTALSCPHVDTPCRSLGGRQCGTGGRGGGAIEMATDQREHLRRCIAKLRAVARDQARERVIDDHCRNRGGEPKRGGEQRLGNARRDYRQIGGLRLRNPDEAVHDAPNGAEQSDEGGGCTDGGQHAGAA